MIDWSIEIRYMFLTIWWLTSSQLILDVLTKAFYQRCFQTRQDSSLVGSNEPLHSFRRGPYHPVLKLLQYRLQLLSFLSRQPEIQKDFSDVLLGIVTSCHCWIELKQCPARASEPYRIIAWRTIKESSTARQSAHGYFQFKTQIPTKQYREPLLKRTTYCIHNTETRGPPAAKYNSKSLHLWNLYTKHFAMTISFIYWRNWSGEQIKKWKS